MGCTMSQSESRPSPKANHKSGRCRLLKKLETSGGIPVALFRECEVDCETCGLIFQASKEWGLPQPLADRQPYRGELRVSLISSAEAGTSFLAIRAGWDRGTTSGRRVLFSAIEGTSNPWGLTGSPRFIESTNSPSSLALARTWLDNCLEQHEECPSMVNSNLPTRVLDLSDPNIIRLKEGGTGRYACLSYCWGKGEFVMTTTENLESHRHGIAKQSLPQTLQDAITFCQALEVHYLWVDALCIIQRGDDGADWNRESVRMADIYCNSFVTIAALSADSVYRGCFNTPKDGIRMGPVMTYGMNHFPTDPNIELYLDFPLLTRGWVYQERMLAPRVLYLGSQELFWDCQHCRTCECGGAEYQNREAQKEDFARLREFPADLAEMQWRKVVQQYSNLQLSFRSDKLPALSGLADRFQQATGQRYWAGLWENSFITDMCWHVDGGTPAALVETQTWTAPTWSWASMDLPVTYGVDLCEVTGEAYGDMHAQAEVLDAHCALRGPSATGPITSGFVDLNCTMLPVTFENDSVCAGSLQLWWHSDGRYKVKEGGKYYLIPLLAVRKTEFLIALVVTPEDEGSEEMVRVGTANGYQWDGPEHFPRSDWTRVRIV